MLKGLEAITKAIRGIKVRARKVTRAAGRSMRKTAPDGTRRTIRARAAELFRGARQIAKDNSVISLRKSLIKKFNAAKTLEAKLKIADEAYSKNMPELALKLYNKVAEEALKNPEKHSGLAKELKKRVAKIHTDCGRNKFIQPGFFKKHIIKLEMNANTLWNKYTETHEGGIHRSYLFSCSKEFERIIAKHKGEENISAALRKKFDAQSAGAPKRKIAFMTGLYHNLSLAAEFYAENIKSLLNLRAVNRKITEEIAENYAHLYFLNERVNGTLPYFNEARNLIRKKIKEGKLAAKDGVFIENYLHQVYGIPITNGVKI